MAFEVMNPKHGNFQRKAKRGGNACSYEQRTRESRPSSICDGIQILQFEAGLRKYLPDKGQHTPDVVAGGKFWNYPTILPVHFGLGI